jgi:hypothetical protein
MLKSPKLFSERCMAETASTAVITSTGSRERQNYLFRQLVSHLDSAGAWEKLFDLLEEKPFLAEQADHFGGFEPSGEDVESRVLPATIHLKDWTRFLRFASLALNLRGLAEALAEPEILDTLAAGGRFNLAQDIADRLTNPLRRAEARAILAAAYGPENERFPDLIRRIEEDLGSTTPTPGTLARVARYLGPELSSRWRSWIERLDAPPQEVSAVWKVVAESWLDRGEIDAPDLWMALSEIKISQLLLDLAARLGDFETADAEALLRRLDSLFPAGDEARRRARALYLGRLVRRHPELSLPAWERWVKAEPFSWSAALTEDGREIFKALDLPGIEEFLARHDDPETRAAVRIAALEGGPDATRTKAALEAVSAIPDGPAKLHGSLRYLEVRPAAPLEEVRGQVAAVAAYLHQIRHDAPPGDLRRYLDLVARFYPGELKRQVEDVAWSPASRPETLLTVARETGQQEVERCLLESAERFASAVSLTEAEGFRVRGELIQVAACRLCLLQNDLQVLAVAVERLLPEEEDDLRTSLAPALAAVGRRKEALQVAEGIRDSKRRFLARLRVLPPDEVPADLLSARSLYGAMASADRLEEELSALSALLLRPFDPQDLARRLIAPVRDQNLQIQALLRLARHTLAFQKSFYGRQQDRVASLEIVRSSLVVETDDRLAALMPEIAALGAEIGGSAAVAEFQEAARRIATLETVPWEARAAALEHLLSRIQAVFLGENQGRRAQGRAAVVLESIACLPLGPETDRKLDDLRQHWHRLLPILLCASERLPERACRPVHHAVRKGLAACDESAPKSARSVIFALCTADRDQRLRAAERLLADENGTPPCSEAIAYLLAANHPEQVPGIAKKLPPELRDDLSLRLIRHRWIVGQPADSLLTGMADPGRRAAAEVWRLLSASDETDTRRWLESLAALAAQGSITPSEPGLEEVLSHLWSFDPDTSRPTLAAIFTTALRGGGRARGEAALRLWLHAHLAPTLGAEAPERLGWAEDSRNALRRSCELMQAST